MRIERHPILEFDRGRKVIFRFDGRQLEACEGDTVAAALLSNEINVFSESIALHRPRGFYCGIGRCCSCNMTINGVPNVRACVTPVEDGMDVRTQRGRGSVHGAR